MQRVEAECVSTKDNTLTRMCVCVVKDGKPIPPKGWELINERCLDQFYASGKTHSQPIFAKRTS